MLSEFLVLFFFIYFAGSPLGFSFITGHLTVVIACFLYLKYVVKNYLFWLLLLLTFFTAYEKRLSIEYILISSSLFFVGFEDMWRGNVLYKHQKRKKILTLIFLVLVILDFFRLTFSERGSLLLWLPVFLSLYYEPLNKKNILLYFVSGSTLFFLNKLSVLIAFIFSTRSKLVYILSAFVLVGYFVVKHDVNKFLVKSLEPRVHISKSVLNGFLNKPFFGHGFGTFALDFPAYRSHVNVLGGRVGEQIVHGHSLFNHFAFELGVVGLLIVASICYLIIINVPKAFIPFLVVSICDSPLVTFNQYLIMGILFSPFFRNLGVLKIISLHPQNSFFKFIFTISGYLIAIFIFIQSLVGHYYYDKNDISKAIIWDKGNPLYYFVRGANNLNTDSIKSEKDLIKATALAEHVSYFYGFLGACQLANNKISEAKITLEKAMKLDGLDGYWCLLYSYANYDNKEVFNEYQKKAFEKNPEIKGYLKRGHLSAPRFIGYSKHGDARLAGFYRRGEKIFFPLPVIE